MNFDRQTLYQHDLNKTEANLQLLKKNRNLLFWYSELYRELLEMVPDVSEKKILEIGSGNSPLKEFFPNVITSDILKLSHLDHVFDCHDINNFTGILDHSIDIMILTNVLHHLQDPIKFLCNATQKLKKGGELFILEPYFSLVSYPLFRFLHHESVDFSISRPVLSTIEGPLSSSNQAIPYMIFFSKKIWLNDLAGSYNLAKIHFSFYSSISYMITGGISRVFPVPHHLYQYFFKIDRSLALLFPNLFASFFIVKLVSKR